MSDLDAMTRALLARPLDDTVRGALRDLMEELGCWTWEAVRGLVMEHPESDGPRLLAATWFELAGQVDRAEFVRVQCELERLPACEVCGYRGCAPGAGRRFNARRLCPPHPLRSREQHAFYAAFGGWPWPPPWDAMSRRPAPDPSGVYVSLVGDDVSLRAGFSRGFAAWVEMSAADWLEHGDAITAEHPVLEVTLATWPVVESRYDPSASVTRYWFPGRRQTRVVSDLERHALRPELAGVAARAVARDLLGMEWNRVKVWNLPPAVIHVDGNRHFEAGPPRHDSAATNRRRLGAYGWPHCRRNPLACH